MKVKNLNELFTEFKKYRETKKNAANEKNFYDYVSSGAHYLQISQPGTTEARLIEQEGITLKDYPNLIFDLKTRIGGSEIGGNISRILEDIGITGEIKETYGLDLNGPDNQQNKVNQQEYNANKPTENPNSNPKSDKKRTQLKSQIQELKTKNEQLQKEKKFYGIISSLVLVSLVALVIWLFGKIKLNEPSRSSSPLRG